MSASTEAQVQLNRRARAIFDAAVELDIDGRERVLGRLTDPDLRGLVQRLLAQDDEVEDATRELRRGPADLLDDPPLDLADEGGWVGRFRILREIGRGGMGVVYEAEQQVPKRSVALKTIRLSVGSAVDSRQLRREVELMARVTHPGIPAVYEYFEYEGRPVLVMERVQGERADRWATGRALPDVVALLADICAAVSVAHEAGVVHRDLKPANVLVTSDGLPKVLDFGIACLGGDAGVRLSGTPAYMAPEQLEGAGADAATDVYALGVLGWRLCTGALPIDLETLTPERMVEVKRAVELGPTELPRSLDAILRRAQAPAAADRYATVAELEADLRRHLAEEAVVALGRTRSRRARAFVRRRRRLLAGALGLAIAVAAGLVGALALHQRAEHRAVAREAEAALASLRSVDAGPGSPRYEAAFEAVVSEPRFVDTRAPAHAWLHRGAAESGRARRASAVRAFSSAVHPEDERASLEALATVLEQLQELEPMSRVLDRLPPGAVPELRATHRRTMDRADIVGLGEAFRAPLEALSTQAQAAVPGLQARLPSGDLVGVDAGVVTVHAASGALRRRLAVGDGSLRVTTEGERVLIVQTRRVGAGFRTVVRRLDPATGEVRVVDRYDARYGSSAVETSPGGAPRRVTWTTNPAGIRAGPVDSASTLVQANPSPPAARPLGGAAWGDLDGDGFIDLVTATSGWRGHGVRVYRGPDFELAGLLRFAARSVAVVQRPDGAPEVVAIGMEAGARGLPLPDGSRDPFHLVRAGLTQGGWEVRQRHPTSGVDRRVRVLDLDGDGVQEVALVGLGVTLGVWRGGELEFTRVGLPGEVVGAGDFDDDPGAELLVRTDASDPVTLVVGARGGEPLVVPTPGPNPPRRSLPEGAPGHVARAWARAQDLTELGLARDALPVLEALAARGGEWGDRAALEALRIAEAIPASGNVGDAERDLAAQLRVARLLVQGGVARLSEPDRRRIESVAALSGAPDLAAALGSKDSEPAVLDLLQPLASSPIEVVRPEAVRAGRAGVRLAETRGDGAALVRLPLRNLSDRLVVDATFAVHEFDFSAKLGMRLAGASGSVEATAGRGGGGRPEDHHVSLRCARSVRRWQQFADRIALRLIWDPAEGRVGCALGDALFGESRAPADLGGEVALEIYTEGTAGYGTSLVDVELTELVVRGASPSPGPATAAERAVDGDLPTLREVMREPTLTGAWAASELGQARSADLTGLTDAELAFLLRTRPSTWNEPVRSRLESRFGAVWAATWGNPVHFGTARARTELVHAALSELSVDDPELLKVVLQRARVLSVEGRRVEARSELLRLAAAGSAESMVELASLDHAAGRPDRAQERLAEAARTPFPDWTAELLEGRPELRALAPPAPFPVHTVVFDGEAR